MKYLSNYLEKGSEAIMEKAGAFYAFSQEQFSEKEKDGVKYISLGSGLICEKGKEKVLIDELLENYDNAVAQDLKENGKYGVIKRELFNHEAFYTGSITDTQEALGSYGFTHEEILDVYRKEYKKIDWDNY